ITELYGVPLAAHHDPQIHVHAVAASPTGFILESFADPTRDPLWFELFAERPAIVDGFMAVPDAPGLGLELRRDTLEKYGVRLHSPRAPASPATTRRPRRAREPGSCSGCGTGGGTPRRPAE